MIKVYGIKNCDTMKKAFTWLDEHNIKYSFHDYKIDGLTTEQIDDLLKIVDWNSALNKKSTTWRKLDDSVKNNVTTQKQAKQIMLDNTSIIKRPIIIDGEKTLVGFSNDLYQKFFE